MSHAFDWKGLCTPEQGIRYGEQREAEVTFLFNGDFSGNVGVNLPNWVADITLRHGAGPNGQSVAEVHIPFEAMKRLVLEYYRRQTIAQLENIDAAALEVALGPTIYKEMVALLRSQTVPGPQVFDGKEWKQTELPIVDKSPETLA